MLFLTVFTLIIFLLYFGLQTLYFSGLLKLKAPTGKSAGPEEATTVVIPFRNELPDLGGIIGDLLAQDFPAHLFKVLLVNDHSSDGSENLVRSLIMEREQFYCMDLPDGMEGKKEAIAFAVSEANTPWILQTDADCRVGSGFLSAHMNYLASKPADLVAGMLTTKEGKGGFLEAFERLDILGLTGAGAGSFGIGRPIMCSGANLLYHVDLYRETRTFDPTKKTASGDDMFLLIGARKLNKKLAFNPHPDCLVKTGPKESLSDLIRQRIRWGAKSSHYKMAEIQLVALLVALTNILMLIAPVWICLQPGNHLWLLPAMGLKLLADFLILAAASFKTGQSRSLLWFLPLSLLYPIFMAVVMFGSLIYRPAWKGRSV